MGRVGHPAGSVKDVPEQNGKDVMKLNKTTRGRGTHFSDSSTKSNDKDVSNSDAT